MTNHEADGAARIATSATTLGSTGSLFSRTLQEITTTKLDELTKKRNRFEEDKRALLTETAILQDPIECLEACSLLVKKCFDVPVDNGRVILGRTQNLQLEIDLVNIDRFIDQARYDPSISPRIREQWLKTLRKHVDIQSLKYTYATLYGKLTTEWLEFRNPSSISKESGDTEMEDFEHVAASKKLEGRQSWEQQVFEPARLDPAAVEQMLRNTFEPDGEEQKPLREAIQDVRSEVRHFERELSPSTFTLESLGWTIQGLLGSDLLTDEKREVLRDFQANPVILTEIADVLNMWVSTPETWTWGNEVFVEERRGVDGVYRVFLHEDLLQAIFLHHLGTKWAVAIKSIFKSHRANHQVWKVPYAPVPLRDRNRREYYLGNALDYRNSVASKRRDIYRESYFLSVLPDHENQQSNSAEGDEEADFEDHIGDQVESKKKMLNRRAQTQYQKASRGRTRQTARKQSAPTQSYGYEGVDEDDSTKRRDPMDCKQTLLHLLATEILIGTRFHGEITCFRSQFEGLFSSLAHQTILQALEFFGCSPRWIQFFQNFLQAPLRFTDDRVGPIRIRQRGVPGSHVLSEFFAETILFILDFQVNRSTGGEPLWRVHDDFWFWSTKESACESAWNTITSFAETMGLNRNANRTGCARIRRNDKSASSLLVEAEPSRILPRGQIRWGMLRLNPQSGRFEIDEAMVEKHITELSKQLKDKAGSVFAWIGAWNAYAATFFSSNFGKAANCNGRAHVDNMLATHERIQREVFSSLTGAAGSNASGSVVEFLKQTIAQRFGISDIPDGYFFFPVELGGLDLQSPFVTLLQVRDTVVQNPAKLLNDFEAAERAEYRAAKGRYERGEVHHYDHLGVLDKTFQPEHPDEFLSFEEFTRYREVLSATSSQTSLENVFTNLLSRPNLQPVASESNGNVRVALNNLGGLTNLRGILGQWDQMEPYWQWVVQLYGSEMIERYGGLSIVDPGLLPIGMVGLFRSGRVKWQE